MPAFIEDNFLLIFCVITGIYLVAMAIWVIRKKKKDKEFEASTPDIVKVHMENGMSAYQKDGQALKTFSEGIHRGFYLDEGEHTIMVSFTYETFNKHVTIQEKAITINVEAAKEYDLDYDKTTAMYTFKER